MDHKVTAYCWLTGNKAIQRKELARPGPVWDRGTVKSVLLESSTLLFSSPAVLLTPLKVDHSILFYGAWFYFS